MPEIMHHRELRTRHRMNIYIHRDGKELGPYSWIEIYVELKKGNLSYLDDAQIDDDPERRSLEAFRHWSEGTDVGPFTWDEILFLLKEGCLDRGTPAKIEGIAEFSTLGELLAGRPLLLKKPSFLTLRLRERWVIPATSTAAILLLLIAGLASHFGFHRKANIESPKAAIPLVIADLRPTNEPPFTPVKVVAPVPAILDAEHITDLSGITLSDQKTGSSPTLTAMPVKSASLPTSVSNMASNVSAEQKPKGATLTEKPVAIKQSRQESITAIAPTSDFTKSVSNYFTIRSIKFLKKEPKDGVGVWTFGETKNKRIIPDEFQQCLEVSVSAAENTRSDQLIAKAYFFDSSDKIVFAHNIPSKAGKHTERNQFPMPVLFKKDDPVRLFFEVPVSLRDQKWKVVVVFGDKFEAKTITYPLTASDFLLKYPEKDLAYDRTAKSAMRKPVMDPLVEHIVKTKNPRQPQITLFLRLPKGVSDASQVEGVMAICVLGDLAGIKRDLQLEEMPGDYAGLFSFANKNKLAILAWGSRSLWDGSRNYDQLTKEETKSVDESLDIVANAWARGVQELSDKYGIPDKNFLLWGNCGSAQWAARLCLRKPEFFLAIHVHMPGSYDRPTPEAAKVLWCLTIGELEAGYERSKSFVAACHQLGYPMVYKSIVGLGHAGDPNAAALGFEFFDFALRQKALREELDSETKKDAVFNEKVSSQQPWIASFRNPPYYGDLMNQEVFPASEVDMIPASYRVPIPTKAMADIWARSK